MENDNSKEAPYRNKYIPPPYCVCCGEMNRNSQCYKTNLCEDSHNAKVRRSNINAEVWNPEDGKH